VKCHNCGVEVGNWKLDPGAYSEIARRYTTTDDTLQDIGDDYGVTRERIRQILPVGVKQAKKLNQEARRRSDAFNAACQRAIDNNLVCVVCSSWILRRASGGVHTITCSPECAEAWLHLRTFDEFDKHRQQMARTYLANSEKYPRQQEWAKAMLGPNPPPRNRRWVRPGSARAEAIRKHRPELYAELVGAAS
jgi:hypothetical protein